MTPQPDPSAFFTLMPASRTYSSLPVAGVGLADQEIAARMAVAERELAARINAAEQQWAAALPGQAAAM
jgi:hypothetical protein